MIRGGCRGPALSMSNNSLPGGWQLQPPPSDQPAFRARQRDVTVAVLRDDNHTREQGVGDKLVNCSQQG